MPRVDAQRERYPAAGGSSAEGTMVAFALAIFHFEATKRHNPRDDLPPVSVRKEPKERQLKKNSCAMPNGMPTRCIFLAPLI